VRAKVSAIRAGQGDDVAAEHAHRLLRLAEDHLEAGRVRLVLVGGPPGVGKSTLAEAIATSVPATVLRSDVLRKELAGMPADQPAPAAFGEELYDQTCTDRTYEALLQRAEVALGHGETVVLDASWTAERWRAEARGVADRTCADLVELCCEAPEAVAAERLRRRAATGDASDATPDIARALRASMAVWPEATVVDTSGSIEASVAAALEVVAPR
jgi:predicted kinase